MLDPRYEVWHKLLDGAFILDGAGDTLCDLHLIPLTAWRVGMLSPVVQGSENPTLPLQGTDRAGATQEDPHSSRSHILGYERQQDLLVKQPQLWSGQPAAATHEELGHHLRSTRGQGREDEPEVPFLAAAALLHGVQGTHASVLLKSHPV